MCMFHEDNLRHLAWLAKFETLPASVICRKDQDELFFNTPKKIIEDATIEAYDLNEDDIFDADGECVLEFEASVRNGADSLRFARQARDIAQIIPKPDKWWPGDCKHYNPYIDKGIPEHPLFWEAAARAFLSKDCGDDL